MSRSRKLVCGVGLNDAGYKISKKIYLDEILPSGRRKQKLVWKCNFYSKWSDMIVRCYSEKAQDKVTTYRGCTVCEEWMTFSNFKKWMENEDWKQGRI